jgi:chemotaxis response regulator CheB
MLNWLKDKWEFVAAGIAVVAVFLLGRKGKSAADRKVELKEKEIDVVNKANEKELAATKAAADKHVKEIINIHADAEQKLKQAEEDRDNLVRELVDDPNAIDEKIKELGIKEI